MLSLIDEIKRVFELSEGTILSIFTNDNRYTKQKLQTDLENLESFYKDRGYFSLKYLLLKFLLVKIYKSSL